MALEFFVLGLALTCQTFGPHLKIFFPPHPQFPPTQPVRCKSFCFFVGERLSIAVESFRRFYPFSYFFLNSAFSKMEHQNSRYIPKRPTTQMFQNSYPWSPLVLLLQHCLLYHVALKILWVHQASYKRETKIWNWKDKGGTEQEDLLVTVISSLDHSLCALSTLTPKMQHLRHS